MKFKTNIEDNDTKNIKMVMQDDNLNEVVRKIMNERYEIIDLFCKTFLISQEPKTIEELKALFELTELECTLGKDCTQQTFRIKLREVND
jgi:hypothetical protein